MADRSVSFDLLAIDKASKALADVAAEVTALGRQIEATDGTIEVDADTAKAREKLAAVDSQLAKLNAKSLKIDADTADATRRLAILEADLRKTTDADRRVRIEGDISAVQAKIRALQAEKISIDVDTAAASAKVAALKASIDGLDRRDVNIGAETGSALSRLAELGTQLRAIQTPVMIPVAVGGSLELISWIGSVTSGLSGIGAAAVVGGGVAIAALQGVGDAVEALGETGPDAAAKIEEAMSGLSPAAQEFARALRGIIDGPLAALQDAAAGGFLPGLQEGIAGFFAEFDGAEDAVRGVARELGEFFAEIGPAAGRAADALLQLANRASGKVFGDLAGGVTDALDAFTEWANSQSAQDIADDIDEIKDSVQSLWDKASAAFDFIQLAWEGITFATNMFDDPIAKVQQLYEAIRQFAEHIPGLGGVLPELDTKVRSMGDAMAVASGSTDRVRSSADAAGPSMTSMAGATDTADQSLRRLVQTQQDAAAAFMTTEQANLRYQEALGRLNESIATNGATVDIHTEKGRANQSALLSMVEAANQNIDAMVRSGAASGDVSVADVGQREELIRVATQLLGTRDKAQVYIDKLLQVPKNVDTKANLDTSQAEAALATWAANLASVQANASKPYALGLFVGRSAGGWIPGAPSERDTVPMMAAAGEFVVRSSAAREWGPALEAINAGADPSDILGAVGAVGPGSVLPPLRLAAPTSSNGGAGNGGDTYVNVYVSGVVGDSDAVIREIGTGLQQGIARGVLPRDLFSARP